MQKDFEEVQTNLEKEDLAEIDSNARARFDKSFMDVKASIKRHLRTQQGCGPAHSSTVINRQLQHDEAHASVIIAPPKTRLPHLHLPTFSGIYTEWSGYIGMFQSIVGGDPELTNIEKFQHLRLSLRDSALEAISSLDLTNENYDRALDILIKRFDNKRINFQAHIRDIFGLKSVVSGSVVSLRELSDKVNAHMRALSTAGTKEQIGDCLLIHLIGSKLDIASQRKWEEETPIDQLPTWAAMSKFLERRCQTMENVDAMVTRSHSKQVTNNKYHITNNNRKVFVASNSKILTKCILCFSTEHNICNCPRFIELSPFLRLKEAKRLQVCLNCLRAGHFLKDCHSRSCHNCDSKHHTMLHLTLSTDPKLNSVPSKEENKTSVPNELSLHQQSALVFRSLTKTHQSKISVSDDFVLLATALIFVKNRTGMLIPCRAILDSASQLNFVSSRFANQLQLKSNKTSTLVSGIGESGIIADSIVGLHFQSRFGDFSAKISAVIIPTITDCQPNVNLDISHWKIPSNLQLADPSFHKTQRIDVLIGTGLFFSLMCVGQLRVGENLPLMQKTKVGWIVAGSGQYYIGKKTTLIAASKAVVKNFDLQLDELVRSFWEVENCLEPLRKYTQDEIDCEMHFKENHRRLPSGGYSVRLPMKMDLSLLGDSYQAALRRFYNLEKRLQRSPQLKSQYSQFLEEYLTLNHMSLVDLENSNQKMHFLPHHCVLKESSTSTKLRVVFDGSAASTTGLSLNDLLHSGPTIQPKLFEILLRFRAFKIAITADICKMYRCVRVEFPDNYLQCILWREHPEDSIRVYKLDTVTYGTKPAAFLAIRSMHQLAIDEEANFPLGSKIVRRDFYVDDMITGGSSVDEVTTIMQETLQLLGKGQYKLRKWCSSDSKVLLDVPDTERETFLAFHDGTDVTKTLGLIWEPKTDQFLFSFKPQSDLKVVTKRSILSTIARFYDPLGLIGPVIAKSKIFLQNLWKQRIDWDESLSQEMHTAWTNLMSEFEVVDDAWFPRLVIVPEATFQIHAFCDASISAYGACVYLRSEYNGNIETNLLCSKSRLAPLKTLTIPKLELSAATLLSELVHSISKLNIFAGDFYCWTDSSIVLSWLSQESSIFNVFVANRIATVQQHTANMAWHHVPTLLNPADMLSRGASPCELLHSKLWKYGPDFLLLSPRYWPPLPGLSQELPERRKNTLLTFSKFTDLSIECKFINSFQKMQRIYAYIYKFGTKDGKNIQPLTLEGLKCGTQLLIRMVQRIHFALECKQLENNKSIASSSNIYSLLPFFDQFGLLRVGGRLEKSSLDFESRHPLILPKNHPLTYAIIEYYHKKLLHAGPQSLLGSIRLKYWPVGGRKTVCRVVNKCVRCFHVKPKIAEHIMGQLPSERVQSSRTFLITGIDFCGPFFYRPDTRNKGPIKSYICLFICFATKASHLELVKDLSTPSFLAALTRFTCTRGKPKVIWSDNATNFVGAKNELSELAKLFSNEPHQEAVKQQCLSDGFDWKFIPPRSPHFGGLWESSIKAVKYHLYRTIGSALLSFEELRTLICQISEIINSRPICSLTEHPDDLDILTPAHFLIGAPLTAVVEPDVTNLNVNTLGRWQRVCYLQQTFWRKWSSEYLSLLQQRSKWRSSTENIQTGTMVLLKDENLPPLRWQMARVVHPITGEDGVVRVVVLRTSSGITKRAVKKICVLPIDNDAVGSLNLPKEGGCSQQH